MAVLLDGWLLPMLYLIGTSCALCFNQHLWRVARVTAGLGLLATLATVTVALAGAVWHGLQVDATGLTLTTLVAFLGWVVIPYSARYLQGEPRQALFVRAMLFTLSCVAVLVVSRHLLVMVLAWSGTSVGLHFLLTHYRERKAAQIVAHKKFIVSRLADVCLLLALVLIYQSAGTLSLDALNGWLQQAAHLPLGLHVAAALFALAAILKTAQLPLHGWLIQVMEAPTPVSALLHAGVVNMGGFVLIRLAELISLAPAAQIMLVLVGSLTAVLAGLVMMTRISIKVRLAWSTCAQMGFMLLEVGLGLYELALLHLVAHSLYKAHAFLGAGDTVAAARQRALLGPVGVKRSLGWYAVSALLSGIVVYGSVTIWQMFLPDLELSLAATVIVSMGLAALLWLDQTNTPFAAVRGFVQVFLLTQLYLLWHELFAGLAPASSQAMTALLAWTVLSFLALYGLQIWLRQYPQGRMAQRLYPWAYNGFYLDESFTRFTFRIWPARLSPIQAQTLVNRYSNDIGGAV